MTNKITLAIETAVGNGSISLFENDKLLDQKCGESKISRSDCFLPILDEFLSKNKIKKKDLNSIAVSRGPGSFNGARVGLATAVAMKNGLNIKCSGISVLRAIAVSSTEKSVITAILNDKKQVIMEKFISDSKGFDNSANNSDETKELESGGAKALVFDDFINEIKSLAIDTKILLERNLFELIHENYEIEKLKASTTAILDFKNIGDNLSLYIGKAAINEIASDNPRVIYLDMR
jgi:tRNA threonylcarbamoyl adenosine modification protein YeaZ